MRKMKMYDSNEYFLVPKKIIPDNHQFLKCGCIDCREDSLDMAYKVLKEIVKQL